MVLIDLVWRTWMEKETQITAEEAQSIGLVHEIRPLGFPPDSEYLGWV